MLLKLLIVDASFYIGISNSFSIITVKKTWGIT